MDYNILSTRICSGSTNDRFVWKWSDTRREMYRLRADPHIMQTEGPKYIIGIVISDYYNQIHVNNIIRSIMTFYTFAGDGGYTLSRVLLIAVRGALPGTPEYEFSNALRRARVRVENVFGILKQVWRCLHKERGLHYDPDFAAQIVQACTVLHNFLRRQGYVL